VEDDGVCDIEGAEVAEEVVGDELTWDMLAV
jgi:hypothetical protein